MDLQAIEARLAAATPGPWSFHILPQPVGITAATIHSEHGPRETCWTVDLPPEIGGMGTDKDTEFIAHAPEDMRALIAEVKRLSGLLDVVKKIHEKRVDPDDPDGEFCCDACRDEWGMLPFWPCPTMRALGVTE